MTTTQAARTPAPTTSLILPYFLVLLAALAALHIYIALQGSTVSAAAAIVLFVIAVAVFIWHLLNRKALNKVRFGTAVTHAMAYVAVNASFALHALFAGVFTGGAPEPGWVGAAITMPAIWGIGLILHLLGVTLGGGWED